MKVSLDLIINADLPKFHRAHNFKGMNEQVIVMDKLGSTLQHILMTSKIGQMRVKTAYIGFHSQ